VFLISWNASWNCYSTSSTNFWDKQKYPRERVWLIISLVSLLHIYLLICLQILLQGKEYVFVANSDNLGAIVDMSILTKWSNFTCCSFLSALFLCQMIIPLELMNSFRCSFMSQWRYDSQLLYLWIHDWWYFIMKALQVPLFFKIIISGGLPVFLYIHLQRAWIQPTVRHQWVTLQPKQACFCIFLVG
jgi:hypothetical protein